WTAGHARERSAGRGGSSRSDARSAPSLLPVPSGVRPAGVSTRGPAGEAGTTAEAAIPARHHEGGRRWSELVAHAHHVARLLVHQPDDLAAGTAVPAYVLAGQVDRLHAEGPVVVELVGHAHVDLVVLLDVVRVVRAAVLVAEDQVLVAPVPRQAGRPAVLLVHQHHVGGVAQAQQRELLCDGAVVEANVAVDDGVVGVH